MNVNNWTMNITFFEWFFAYAHYSLVTNNDFTDINTLQAKPWKGVPQISTMVTVESGMYAREFLV